MAISHVALMPDAHQGFGVPIGSVLFTYKSVVPYAIGVDIGCGVQIARTNLVWEDNFDREKLKNVLKQIQRDVPTGFSKHKVEPLSGAIVEQKLGSKGVDIDSVVASQKATDAQFAFWFERAQVQIGTLGGGNHFLEVQRDEDNRVYFMLHSGSRSLGKNICDHYVKTAQSLNSAWYSQIPDKELAFLPVGTPEFDGYWFAMNFALRWAEINREEMMSKVLYAFTRHASVHTFEVLTDVHHNYAQWENHFGKNGIVHRKGAVSAKLGEMVLIPGSMGTNSYIAEGLGNEESFSTCQHGAGRAVGRKEMSRRMTTEQVVEEMRSLNIEFISNEPESAMEEAPSAYKNIDTVMEASDDLIKPLVKLWPLGVVKG
jgi:tRNA-splicing ligase RtcB